MASLIYELDNDALLMMYLADELSVEDRTEVEQMLATDAGLRSALDVVMRDQAAGEAALAAADHVDPPAASPSAAGVALRKVGKAMRQWQVERLIRNRPAPAAERQPRFPRWAYPAAAVVALVVGSIAWWGMQSDNGTGEGTADGRANASRLNNPGVVQSPPDGQEPWRLTPDDGRPPELPVLVALGSPHAELLGSAETQARSFTRPDGSSDVPTIVADGLAE